MSSRPVFVAGIVRTAVMTRTEHQRARGEEKLTVARSQQAVSVAKRVVMYQSARVQSMERPVMRAVTARMVLKRERR
jgi:hypothetical protein